MRTIRSLITQGIIYAMRDPNNSGEYATYASRQPQPTMRVGFDDFGSDPDIREGRKGLLLHECIHAMQDNRNALWMRVDTAEAAAYTAQCLFHRACGRTQRELTGLVASAWEATERILQSRQRSVAENDIPRLMTAIRVHQQYANEFDRTGRYNGVECTCISYC